VTPIDKFTTNCAHLPFRIQGKVTRAFFDKTGTLTRQGLDFISAKCRESWDKEEADISADLVLGMSCCHHLTQSMKGELIGNPVDRTMFYASGATLVSAGAVDRIVDGNGKFVDILKHFDFDHHRMTQSELYYLCGSYFLHVKYFLYFLTLFAFCI
jgi:magnesium-transporting ATPase (P-type)